MQQPRWSSASVGQPVRLAHAHAHNDYLHDRPLLDALECGFASVEADVWLVDGQLLVAHDLADVNTERTLESMYLDPLEARTRRHGGTVYRGDQAPLQLLIDIKSEGSVTYLAVHQRLQRYAAMLTTFLRGGTHHGAVTVVITGNRPRDLMLRQHVRYAACDGTVADLASDLPTSFLPLISDRWSSCFTWDGVGAMPAHEATLLRSIVTQVHARHRRLRFWDAPDGDPSCAAVWAKLLDAGVDYLNTDRLEALSEFLSTSRSTSRYIGPSMVPSATRQAIPAGHTPTSINVPAPGRRGVPPRQLLATRASRA